MMIGTSCYSVWLNLVILYRSSMHVRVQKEEQIARARLDMYAYILPSRSASRVLLRLMIGLHDKTGKDYIHLSYAFVCW